MLWKYFPHYELGLFHVRSYQFRVASASTLLLSFIIIIIRSVVIRATLPTCLSTVPPQRADGLAGAWP